MQREKMAFLGELTAGIAHELQNPLTFVKNFADVSTGLVEEMTGEQRDPAGARPVRNATLKAEILAGLEQNLQQISHHGSEPRPSSRACLSTRAPAPASAKPWP